MITTQNVFREAAPPAERQQYGPNHPVSIFERVIENLKTMEDTPGANPIADMREAIEVAIGVRPALSQRRHIEPPQLNGSERRAPGRPRKVPVAPQMEAAQ